MTIAADNNHYSKDGKMKRNDSLDVHECLISDCRKCKCGYCSSTFGLKATCRCPCYSIGQLS